MKMGIVTLSGTITDPLLVLDRILSYYFRTTENYLGILDTRRSFTEDITEKEKEVDNVKASLNYILDNYFYDYLVEVTSDDTYSSTRNLTIYIKLRVNGTDYSVGRIGEIENNKLANIIIVDNSGGL